MRLLTWNTGHRTRRTSQQLELISRLQPDIVALQEITSRTWPGLRDGLQRLGMEYAADTLADAPRTRAGNRSRHYCVALASRFPIERLHARRAAIPWPEKLISVVISTPTAPVELHAVHVPPGSSHSWLKIDTLERIYEALAVRSTGLRVLCGDFNTPQNELPSGETITWAQAVRRDGTVRTKGTVRGGKGQRWDAAERNILRGLSAYDLSDAYRLVHGCSVVDYSWATNRNGKAIRRSFDHVFACQSLRPLTAEYHHSALAAGLSDHAPLNVFFNLAA